MNITKLQLVAIMPSAGVRAVKMLDPINSAMEEFQINTPLRQAAFLAQVAHESMELRYMAELGTGFPYEGRADLGNTEKGDGERFKGRGLLQITGRANYAACGNALKMDLLSDPQQLQQPEAAARSAGWFWCEGAALRLSRAAKSHLGGIVNLNDVADVGDFYAITLAINGGLNGLLQRTAYYNVALEVLQPKSMAE